MMLFFAEKSNQRKLYIKLSDEAKNLNAKKKLYAKVQGDCQPDINLIN